MRTILQHRFRKATTIMLAVIALLALLTAYWIQTAPESLIGNDPCAPPCWHGIVPGETTKQDALETMGTLSFINRHSLIVKPSHWKESTNTKLESLRGKYKGFMLTRGDIFMRIEDERILEIVVDLPRKMSLAQALRIHGEPARYSVVQNPDHSLYYSFMFPDKGLCLTGSLGFQPVNLITATIEGRIRVFEAEYFPPMDLGRFLVDIRGWPEETAASILESCPPWPGLGAEVQVRPLPTPTPEDTMWWKEGLQTIVAQRTPTPTLSR